jgi:hypothetical protein
MRTWMNRAIATAAAATIALTTFSLQPAAAHPRGGNDAAAFAAFAAIFGTIAAIAAAEHDRDQSYYAPSYRYGAPYGGWHPEGHYHHRW